MPDELSLCQHCDEFGTPERPVTVHEDADREFWLGRKGLHRMHDDCYDAMISGQEWPSEIGGPFRSDMGGR